MKLAGWVEGLKAIKLDAPKDYLFNLCDTAKRSNLKIAMSLLPPCPQLFKKKKLDLKYIVQESVEQKYPKITVSICENQN